MIFEDDDETGNSIFVELGIDPGSKEIEFLIQLAKGEHKVWLMEN